MAGYSGKPLAEKLGIFPGSRVALLGGPSNLRSELPPGVRVFGRAGPSVDVAVAFFTSRGLLERRVERLERMIFPAGALWIAWPKRASGVGTSVDESVIREVSLPRGLVDNKVCAIDATWSALRLVWRVDRRSRPGA